MPIRMPFRFTIRRMMLFVAAVAIALAISSRPVTRWDAPRIASAKVNRPRLSARAPMEVVSTRWDEDSPRFQRIRAAGFKGRGVWTVTMRNRAAETACVVDLSGWDTLYWEYSHGPRAAAILRDLR